MDKEEDLQHIYEVNDFQEYENNKGSSRPHMIIRENGGAGMGRLASMVLGIGVVLLFISLVAIIATTASILTHLTTLPICENSQANTDNIVNPTASTGTPGSFGGSNAVNCSISNVLEGQQNQLGIIQNQIGQLLNATHETASKVNEIRTLANEQAAISVNNTYNIEQVMQTTGNTAQKLVNIVNTLTNLKNTSTSTAGVVDDILLILDELLELHSDNSTLPYSCAEIKQRQPNSPSGVYLLINPNGNGVTYAYCHMGELCGSGGGWQRIAYIDMSDATQTCPSGFRLYQSGGVRACGRPSSIKYVGE
uniref:Fibrinogen C-terminal domain-containing protein n=1 Tax=Amphimedon queenslandica TaxID=400682 RepID=A0A1X7T243_AMPQE